MLKQGLEQKLLQKLSPQQIQLIKLLEIPTAQLEERIKKELQENPALDEGADDSEDEKTAAADEEENEDDSSGTEDEFSLEDYLDEDDTPSYKLVANNYSKDDERKEIPLSGSSSFQENLLSQLGLRTLTEKQIKLATYIIGNIDDDGYLRRETEAIVDDLAFNQNIETTEKELLEVLSIIQEFDPAGVGARDLRECLLLQVGRIEHQTLDTKHAYKILKDFFQEFTKKHYDKIQKKLNLTDDGLKNAIDEILRLSPKPGGSFADSSSKSSIQITPDFILENDDGSLRLSLNQQNMPELRVTRAYVDMFNQYNQAKSGAKQNKDAAQFVKQKIDSAKWFIDAIRQRQNTLMMTMNSIVEYQKEYFLEGDETLLKPMILKDIADRTGLDISTISRVANSKYIQTHFGIYALKYFFSEGMQTDAGEEVSTREIKSILKECIGGENKKKPLTDDKLAKILKEKGYHIARRTVAKYREQLNIPVARLRKELN